MNDPIEQPFWERPAEKEVDRVEPDEPTYVCAECGKRTLNTGHWPYCSAACEWAASV